MRTRPQLPVERIANSRRCRQQPAQAARKTFDYTRFGRARRKPWRRAEPEFPLESGGCACSPARREPARPALARARHCARGYNPRARSLRRTPCSAGSGCCSRRPARLPRGAVRRRDAAARPAPRFAGKNNVVLLQEAATRRPPAAPTIATSCRRREEGDAGGGQHLHQQGSPHAQPAARRFAAAPLLPGLRASASLAARDQPRLGRHRRAAKATC